MQYDDGTRETSQEYDVPDWFASPTAPVYVVKGSMDRYRGDLEPPKYSDEGKAAIFGVGIATDSSKTLSSITVEIIEIPDTFALLGGAATTKSFESVTSPPGAPTGVSAIGLNKSASVSFTPPTSNGGATITGYTVTSLPDSKTCTTSDAGSLTCDVTDLTNGTAYTFTVTATNALGTSAASAPSNSVTPAAPASTPECSDESIDWATAATEEGWSCTVGGEPYEYADFHVLTVVEGNSTDICKSSLPINVDNQDNDALFCTESEGVVRAIFDWDNRSSAPNPLGTRLTWLDTVSQIGSRKKEVAENCGTADQTVADRCANQLAHGKRAFVDMAGAGGPAIADLNISNLKTLTVMFAKARKFNEDISKWDTSAITEMQYLFQEAEAFNQNVGGWETSAVKNMLEMFKGAAAFNQDISAWDTAAVKNMKDMFGNASAFNQDLSAWAGKLTQLTTMENMFKNASAFNNGSAPGASDQPLNWTAPNLGLMNYAFAYATSFNQQIFADGASTANVTNMSGMFKGATAFNQHIGGWNTQSLDKAASMFEDATAFNKDIGNWSMGVVTNMNAMFKNAEAFNQDLSGWALGKRAIDLSSFDEGADAWCGLGFRNRGRPDAVSPSEAESCALSLVIDAPESAVAGDQFDYVLRYYNESATDLNSGALSLTLPTALSVVDPGAGTASGQTVSWSGLEVPAGSSSDGGGGEQSVTVQVDAGVSEGAELVASATLTDGADISVNDISTVFATSQAVLNMEIYRGDGGGDFVLPGETILYKVVPGNTGLSNTEGGQLTISWSGEVPFAIESKNGARCTDTRCELALEIDAGGRAWTSFVIRVGADAQPGLLTATASMTATNAVSTPGSTDSITTEVGALPSLVLDMETLPAAVVGLNDEFKVVLEVDNVGSTGAGPTSLTLNVPNGASFVSASNDGAVSNSVISWTIPSLDHDEDPSYLVASLRAPSTTGAMILKAEASTSFTPQNGGTREIRADVTESLRVDDAPVLDLQLAMSPDPVAPGDELVMAFTYQNVGHLAANEVVLTSRVPAETTLDLDATTADVVCADPCVAGSTVTVDVGTLQAQANGTARLVLVVDNDTTALQISGVGALAGKNGVDALVPQAASASVQVVDGPILEVTQRADRDYVAPGGLVTYQIDYLNRGLAAANDVLLDDVIPADTSVDAAPGATATDAGVSWSTDTLGVGSAGTALIRLEVAGNAKVDATLGNVVTLGTESQQIYAAPYNVQVVDGAVLETDIATLPSVAAPGKPFIYTVSYANNGSAAATDVTLQFAVPADVTVSDCDGCTVDR